MSARETKLLIFFAAAGFIVVNFLLFGFFKSKAIEVERKRDQARQTLDTAEMFSASREQVLDEMEWLAEHEPEPVAEQDAQTKLQQLCEAEAGKAGLTVNTQKPQPSDTNGIHFHRAKMTFSVTGTELQLYTWLDRINMPNDLRIAASIRLSPNKKDDTKIDCTATIEQWFVPIPPTA